MTSPQSSRRRFLQRTLICILGCLTPRNTAAETPGSSAAQSTGRLPSVPTTNKPKLVVLSIGVSDYQKHYSSLRFAAKDAQDLAQVLSTQKGWLYEEVQTRILVNEGATRATILDGLEWLETQMSKQDVAILYLGGHGIRALSSGEYLYLPHDADVEHIRSSTVPSSELLKTAKHTPGKVVVFLDTCYAGQILGNVQMRGPSVFSDLIAELTTAGEGVVVFASSSGWQPSLESPEWQNGAFTKALVEALRGFGTADAKGRITLTAIDTYVAKRVKVLTQGRQTPTTAKLGMMPDYPLVMKRRVDDVDVPAFH